MCDRAVRLVNYIRGSFSQPQYAFEAKSVFGTLLYLSNVVLNATYALPDVFKVVKVLFREREDLKRTGELPIKSYFISLKNMFSLLFFYLTDKAFNDDHFISFFACRIQLINKVFSD